MRGRVGLPWGKPKKDWGPDLSLHKLRKQTRPIQIPSRLRALFLAVGVEMFEGRNPSPHPPQIDRPRSRRVSFLSGTVMTGIHFPGFWVGDDRAPQHISSGCASIKTRVMLQWAELDHAEPELRDESPSPSPSPSPTHHPPSTSPSTFHQVIPFPIKAAVEFVARDASICGLDAGDWGITNRQSTAEVDCGLLWVGRRGDGLLSRCRLAITSRSWSQIPELFGLCFQDQRLVVVVDDI